MTKKKQRRSTGKLEPIETVIKEAFGKGKFGGSTQVAELWSQWKEIVGEDAADHCLPEKIIKGKLYVVADSPIWRQQIDLLKEEIKEKIDERLGDLKIEELVMR